MKAKHLENKALGRYHVCPKLNFESTNSSDHEINLTDVSCNSTCICQKSKVTQDSNASAEVTSNASDSTRVESSFLHSTRTNTDSTARNEEDADKSRVGEKNANNGEKPTNSGEKDADKGACTSSPANEPRYFTQVRTTGELKKKISPQFKLFKNLADVNNSDGDLDASLVPTGSAIVYDPSAKYPVTLTLDDADNDELEEPPEKAAKNAAESSNAISPGSFYTKLKPWQ